MRKTPSWLPSYAPILATFMVDNNQFTPCFHYFSVLPEIFGSCLRHPQNIGELRTALPWGGGGFCGAAIEISGEGGGGGPGGVLGPVSSWGSCYTGSPRFAVRHIWEVRGEVFRGRFSGCVKFEVGSLSGAGRSGSWTGGEVVCQLARRILLPA